MYCILLQKPPPFCTCLINCTHFLLRSTKRLYFFPLEEPLRTYQSYKIFGSIMFVQFRWFPWKFWKYKYYPMKFCYFNAFTMKKIMNISSRHFNCLFYLDLSQLYIDESMQKKTISHGLGCVFLQKNLWNLAPPKQFKDKMSKITSDLPDSNQRRRINLHTTTVLRYTNWAKVRSCIIGF
jgi:hypothetical protein